MHYIEQSIRPEIKQIAKPDNDGLNKLAEIRLGRAMLFKEGTAMRGEVFSAADAMVPAILSDVNNKLNDNLPIDPKPIDLKWKAEDKFVMTALHILSISGYESNYGPLNNDGIRVITTKHSKLLHAVNNILVEAAAEVDGKFKTISDPKARGYTVSTLMDEVAYTVFCKLRGESEVPTDNELLIYETKTEDASEIDKPKYNSA